METIQGPARRWLLRQRCDDSESLVREAPRYLERQGRLERITVPGGKVMYRMATCSRVKNGTKG